MERQKRFELEQRLAAEIARREELVEEEIRLRQKANLQVNWALIELQTTHLNITVARSFQVH